MKLTVNTNATPVKIDAKIKYGKVNIPSSLSIGKHIQKNSDMEMLAGDKGEIILIRGYDNTILIKYKVQFDREFPGHSELNF